MKFLHAINRVVKKR